MTVQADLVAALTETLAALQSSVETKDRVRTAAGARRFGQPIGSVITADPVITPLYQGMFSSARSGGGTLNVLTGERPTTGFCVAERGKNREIPETIFFDPERGKAALKAYVRDHADDLGDGKWLGLWHDTDNREMVLDVVMVLGDREQAIFAGIENNQQAIYDIAADDVIDTGGTGDRSALKTLPVPGAVLTSTLGADASVRLDDVEPDVAALARTAAPVPGDGVTSSGVLSSGDGFKMGKPNAVANKAQMVDLETLLHRTIGLGPDPHVDVDPLPSDRGESGVPVVFKASGPEQARTKPRIVKRRNTFAGVRLEAGKSIDGNEASASAVGSSHDDMLSDSGGTGDRAAAVKDLHGATAEAGQGDDGGGTRRVGGRGVREVDRKVVRHVRTPAGRRRFKQPIGAAIVPDAQLELPDMPDMPRLIERDAPRLKNQEAAQMRKDAYYKARDAQALLDSYVVHYWGGEPSDGISDENIVDTLRNTYGLEPEDAYGDNAQTVAGVVAETSWGMFGACRDIREAAYDLLGYQTWRDSYADHNLQGPTPTWGGGDRGLYQERARTYAYAMLDKLSDEDRVDFPLYRGMVMNTEVDEYVRVLRVDDTFDMPLGSFTDYRPSAERFTGGQAIGGGEFRGPVTDAMFMPNVLFVLQKGARAIQGGSMGTPEEINDPDSPLYDPDFDDEYQNHEFISGGRFKVMSVHKSEKKNQTLIYIKQIGTFNPLSGVMKKKMDWTGERCPFASIWDEPFIKREPKGESKVRHVRTPEGQRRYDQAIGTPIVADRRVKPVLRPRRRLDSQDMEAINAILARMGAPGYEITERELQVPPNAELTTDPAWPNREVVRIRDKNREYVLYPQTLADSFQYWFAADTSAPDIPVTMANTKQDAIDDLLGYSYQSNTGDQREVSESFLDELKQRWITWNGKIQTGAQVREYLRGRSRTIAVKTGSGWRDSGVPVRDLLDMIHEQPVTVTFRGLRLDAETIDQIMTTRIFHEPLGTSTGDSSLAEDFANGDYGMLDDNKPHGVVMRIVGPSYALHAPVRGTDYDEHWISGEYEIRNIQRDFFTGNVWMDAYYKGALQPPEFKERFAQYDAALDHNFAMSEFTAERTTKKPEKKVRRVRTAAGVKFFGLPIGSVIGFTGTRQGMTKEQRSKVAQIVKGVSPKMAHHGDAVGADTDFHKVARKLKVPIHRHPSNLPAAVRGDNKDADITSKPKPPLERNKDIVARSAVIIATPSSDVEERRSGTWATIRAARKSKTPVIIVFPDGTVKREGFAAPSPKPISTPPAPAPSPTTSTPSPTPLAAGTGVNLRIEKPSKNFPKGKYEKIITPSGEWYHVGNFGTAARPNWRVYKEDDYSRKGIVSTKNKTRLDAIQWIRDKHAKDVVVPIGKGTNSTQWTPDDDKRYQHNYKLPKSAIADITAIHDGTKFRDILPWRVENDMLITDSYDGYLDVLKRIERRRDRHQKRADDMKLSHNQRTHERAVVRGLQKTMDDLRGMHNTGLLVHKEDPLNEQRAWSRAIALIHEDGVLDRMSPLARWARGGEISVRGQYTKRQVIANLRAILKRREKAGLDNTGAEELYNWLRDERVKPTITKIPVQHIPRTHQWRRPPDPNRRVGGTPASYQGDEIWISDVTYDDPKNPGKVINLKFIKTKHPDGTYSIQYPDGTIKPYPDQRSANAASLEWLRDNTPPVPMSAKNLLAGILFDIQTALVETKVVRNVIDSDYWGLPVGTPLTGHEYRPHPRERVGRLIPKHGSRQSGAATSSTITKQPSKYEDYDLYTDASGREFYVGEVEDGFWVATRGDEMDVWPATGMSQAEVLRELRKYVERTAAPPAPAPAPVKKAARKLVPKAPTKKKVAKKAPAKKATAKRVVRKAPQKRAAAPTAPRTAKTTVKPRKPSTGVTAPRKKGIPRGQLSIVDRKNGDITVTRDQDGTVYEVKKTAKGYSVVDPVTGHTHESLSRTGVLVMLQRNFAVDRGVMEAGMKERHNNRTAWKKKYPTGDPLEEGAVSKVWNGQQRKTIDGYHYATFEDRLRAMKIGTYGGGGPMSRNVFVVDGFDKMTDAQIEKLEQPVYYFFKGTSWGRGYTEAFHKRQQKKNFAVVESISASGADKKISAYLDKHWMSDPVAACLRMVWIQGMRPSQDDSQSAKGQTYGATNLQRRHVFMNEEPGVVILRFMGKDYKEVEIRVTEPKLVDQFKVICKGPDVWYKPQTTETVIDPKTGKKKKVKKGKLSDCYAETPALLAGPQLFPTVKATDLVRMLKDISGDPHYTSKKLRTYLSCVMAKHFVASHKPPKNEEEWIALVKQCSEEVSAELGNTPAVVRGNYIDPNIWAPWQKAGWEVPK